MTISRTSPSHSSTHHSLWCTSCTKQTRELSTLWESYLLWLCSSGLHPSHGTCQSQQSMNNTQCLDHKYSCTYIMKDALSRSVLSTLWPPWTKQASTYTLRYVRTDFEFDMQQPVCMCSVSQQLFPYCRSSCQCRG